MIPTSRSAHRHLLQTVSTSAHTATNVATKAMTRTAGVATTRTVSTSSSVIRPAVIARNTLGNNHRASTLIKRPERTIATESGIASNARKPLFDKILIANRGEIACRVIRTAKRLGIKTVAVYSEVDRNSMHVEMADEAYCIGPAPSAESYLRIDKIIEVAKKSGAQAIHPGYGFLSENAKFAVALQEAGIVFIGPPISAITSMASKSESKDIMLAAGVPCVPGYHGTNQDPLHLLSEAEHIGFPVLIKAVLGGGGKGMRIVRNADEFLDALESAKRESIKSFSDDRVLIEKYIIKPRHIEVQVFGDALGNVASLWERDCSVQRRHQKIIEEAPAPGLSESLRKELCDKAAAAAKAVNYTGAGTVEFIFDDDSGEFYFMEMNTRLQVEHPVTEMITRQDLVEWQLQVAAGNPLPLKQIEIPRIGHAFEARIYAENPRNNFLPDVGPLLHISTPLASETVRLEEGFKEGDAIEVYYDPLIAKLVVHGEDRTEALRILRKALEEYQVVGLSTNIEFLRQLASHQAFINGEVETGFIPKHYNELFPPLERPPAEVFAQAALYLVLRDQPSVPATSPWSSLTSRRLGGDVDKRIITVHTDLSDPLSITVDILGPRHYNLLVQTSSGQVLGKFDNIDAALANPKEVHSTLNERLLRTSVISQLPNPHTAPSTSNAEKLHIFHNGHKYILAIPSPQWLLSLGDEVRAATKGGLRAPMPSLIVDVKVEVGQAVKKGQAIIVLESMKTETVLRAEEDGTVKLVACKKGDMVEEGKELVLIEA